MTERMDGEEGAVCPVTGEVLDGTAVPLDQVNPKLAERIRGDRPDLAPTARISRRALDRYRTAYVEDLLRQERGELTELDRQVARSLAEGEMVSVNVEDDYAERRTVGERLADGMATFGGSWAFLGVFALAMGAWIAANGLRGAAAFDPYPFILLNLVLSCLAAVQAPVIMMSQKRQEAKDRLRSLNDYRVNLKAELEIRHLHEKIDHLLSRQWQRLAEIQEMQIELLQDRR
jgi:uncharacterized membrane protein